MFCAPLQRTRVSSDSIPCSARGTSNRQFIVCLVLTTCRYWYISLDVLGTLFPAILQLVHHSFAHSLNASRLIQIAFTTTAVHFVVWGDVAGLHTSIGRGEGGSPNQPA